MGEPAEVQAKVLEGGLNRRRENRTLGGGLACGKEARDEYPTFKPREPLLRLADQLPVETRHAAEV